MLGAWFSCTARDAGEWRETLAWAGLLLALFLASLWGRPDIPIDETRYIGVAWEAWQGGDWLVMHMNGLPYHHKPPLLFWLMGLGWSAFGPVDWWPRAISTLAALACTVMLRSLAGRLWPERAGVGSIAGWLSLAGCFWLLFSAAIMFDVLLAACTLVALGGVLEASLGQGRRGWLKCGLGLGLGILAKGPFIVLFVAPVVLAGPWWGGEAARGRRWWRGALGAGALGAALALAWVAPAAYYGGEEFRRAILWGQVAGRVSGELAHRQPMWFYLPALLLVMFPLSLLGDAWRALAASLPRHPGQLDQGQRFVISWLLPALLALSASGGKQLHYVLPLWPALVLLVAAEWRKRDALSMGLAAFPVFLSLCGLGLIAASRWSAGHWFASYVDAGWRMAGAMVLLLAFALAWLSRSRPALTPMWLALASIGFLMLLLLGVVRSLWPAFDMTPMAQAIARRQSAGVALVHVSAYNDQFHFYGRLRQPLAQIGRAEAERWFAENPLGEAVVYVKSAADLPALQAEFSMPFLSGGVALIRVKSLEAWQHSRN